MRGRLTWQVQGHRGDGNIQGNGTQMSFGGELEADSHISGAAKRGEWEEEVVLLRKGD